jgi:hypothetical protein
MAKAVAVFEGVKPREVMTYYQVAIREDGVVYERWDETSSRLRLSQWSGWYSTGEIIDPNSIPSECRGLSRSPNEEHVRLPNEAPVKEVA